MHIIQALKMALKSLGSNKLRSFLTMLGIIIGTVTVAVLTSVASSVQTAIVSQIRSQSTLTIIMSMKSGDDAISYGTFNRILSENQHEKEDEDYYDYALMLNTSCAIPVNYNSGDDVKETLIFERFSLTEENTNKLTDEQKSLLQTLVNSQKKLKPTVATIYATSANFSEVYDLSFIGHYPTTANEILIDEEFKNTYLDKNLTIEQTIGMEVNFGVDYFTRISLVFDETKLSTEYGEIEILRDVSEFVSKFGLTIREGTENFDETSSTCTFDVDFFTTMTNEGLSQILKDGFGALVPAYKNYLAEGTVDFSPVTVEDIYDATNIKTYIVCGALTADSRSSIVSTNVGSSNSSEVSLLSIMFAGRHGEAYVLLDEDNLDSLGKGNKGINDIGITYACLKFKTEDVMENRTNELIGEFITKANKMYMTDFMLISMNSVASIISTVMGILTTMLTVISIISLVVGGIGIMNIMLVAVTERTREIGIRKAIGAKRVAILTQFLVEALLLSLTGGLIGLGLSALACFAIGKAMGIVVFMPLWVILMSIGFCSLIGLSFGMFPAIKASKMQPIDALRRE